MFFNEINCIKSSISIVQCTEEDIQNYSPTVMFPGTYLGEIPKITLSGKKWKLSFAKKTGEGGGGSTLRSVYL